MTDKIKAIIFDMEGVLIDSSKHIWNSFNLIFKESGFQADNNFIKKHTGMSLRDQLERISTEFGITYDLGDFQKRALQTQLKLMKKDLKENNVLKKILDTLKKMNLKIAVATSSTRIRAEKMLEMLGIKSKFEIIITAEEVRKHKPHPEIYLETAKRLKLKPKECIVIEDAINGVVSGKKAKMKVIGLITRFHGKADLKEAKADFIINSLGEIPKLLKKELNLSKNKKLK